VHPDAANAADHIEQLEVAIRIPHFQLAEHGRFVPSGEVTEKHVPRWRRDIMHVDDSAWRRAGDEGKEPRGTNFGKTKRVWVDEQASVILWIFHNSEVDGGIAIEVRECGEIAGDGWLNDPVNAAHVDVALAEECREHLLIGV